MDGTATTIFENLTCIQNIFHSKYSAMLSKNTLLQTAQRFCPLCKDILFIYVFRACNNGNKWENTSWTCKYKVYYSE